MVAVRLYKRDVSLPSPWGMSLGNTDWNRWARVSEQPFNDVWSSLDQELQPFGIFIKITRQNHFLKFCRKSHFFSSDYVSRSICRIWQGKLGEVPSLCSMSADITFSVQLFEDEELGVFLRLPSFVKSLLSTAPEVKLFCPLGTTRKPNKYQRQGASPCKDLDSFEGDPCFGIAPRWMHGRANFLDTFLVLNSGYREGGAFQLWL